MDPEIITEAWEFLSTPSARRATEWCGAEISTMEISIHALREEGDVLDLLGQGIFQYFYPRPPRGGRPASVGFAVAVLLFLSTPSARRATDMTTPISKDSSISIHALREEGDIGRAPEYHDESNFYPRPPRGGRRASKNGANSKRNFYPRPPRGGRPASVGFAVAVLRFLSTPSARRATQNVDNPAINSDISIHALREEGDFLSMSQHNIGRIFLSTPSARRATGPWLQRQGASSNFYPRPPRGGRPASEPPAAPKHPNFYPRPPRGGRLA